MLEFSPLVAHTPPKKDQIYLHQKQPSPFTFNHAVSEAFDDMAVRSIPLYKTIISAICDWADQYYQQGTYIYDIGCSTGNTIHAICSHLHQKVMITGIDQSPPMIQHATEKNRHHFNRHQVDFLCQDVMQVNLQNASVILANYTLQFIDPPKREALLSKIYRALKPGGIFIISEKVTSSNFQVQETVRQIYEKFKMNSGYSKIEIARKKEALEKVLRPSTQKNYENLLEKVGFSFHECFIKWNNFTTLIAFKER